MQFQTTEQVDQIHIRHMSRIERLRGNNKAKATSIMMNKMLQARQSTANLAAKSGSPVDTGREFESVRANKAQTPTQAFT